MISSCRHCPERINITPAPSGSTTTKLHACASKVMHVGLQGHLHPHPPNFHTHTHTHSPCHPPPPTPTPPCKGHHTVWCSQRKENLKTQPPIHVLTECKKTTIGNTHTHQTVHTDTVRKEETNHQFPLSTESKHTQQILTKHCTLYSKVCTESLERNNTCYTQVSTSSSPFISLTSHTKKTHKKTTIITTLNTTGSQVNQTYATKDFKNSSQLR